MLEGNLSLNDVSDEALQLRREVFSHSLLFAAYPLDQFDGVTDPNLNSERFDPLINRDLGRPAQVRGKGLVRTQRSFTALMLIILTRSPETLPERRPIEVPATEQSPMPNPATVTYVPTFTAEVGSNGRIETAVPIRP